MQCYFTVSCMVMQTTSNGRDGNDDDIHVCTLYIVWCTVISFFHILFMKFKNMMIISSFHRLFLFHFIFLLLLFLLILHGTLFCCFVSFFILFRTLVRIAFIQHRHFCSYLISSPIHFSCSMSLSA